MPFSQYTVINLPFPAFKRIFYVHLKIRLQCNLIAKNIPRFFCCDRKTCLRDSLRFCIHRKRDGAKPQRSENALLIRKQFGTTNPFVQSEKWQQTCNGKDFAPGILTFYVKSAAAWWNHHRQIKMLTAVRIRNNLCRSTNTGKAGHIIQSAFQCHPMYHKRQFFRDLIYGFCPDHASEPQAFLMLSHHAENFFRILHRHNFPDTLPETRIRSDHCAAGKSGLIPNALFQIGKTYVRKKRRRFIPDITGWKIRKVIWKLIIFSRLGKR